MWYFFDSDIFIFYESEIYFIEYNRMKIIGQLTLPEFHDLHGLCCDNNSFWVTCAGKGLLQISKEGKIITQLSCDEKRFKDFNDSRYAGKNLEGKYPISYSFVFTDNQQNIFVSVQKKDHKTDKNGGIYKFNKSTKKLEPVYIGTSWIHDGLKLNSNYIFHDSMGGLVVYDAESGLKTVYNYAGDKYFHRGLVYNQKREELISFSTEKESMKNKYGFQRITGKFSPKATIMDTDLKLKRIVDLGWTYNFFNKCTDIRLFSAIYLDNELENNKQESKQTIPLKHKLYIIYYKYFWRIYLVKDLIISILKGILQFEKK